VALFVPKRLLTIVVPDDVVTKIVKSLIKVNQTGKAGDGKIFVSPIEGAFRVRTGETGGEAIA
jgi:nitrogen regulatory protein PII 2